MCIRDRRGVSEKYDREWLYQWIYNSTAMVKSGDPQAVAVYEEYNRSVMTSFPQLSTTDIDNILAYTDYIPPAPVAAVAAPGAAVAASSSGNVTNNIILAALAMVFAILIVMLFLVQKTLIKIAAASGVDIRPVQKPKRTPIWKAFAQNQFMVFVSVCLLYTSPSPRD